MQHQAIHNPFTGTTPSQRLAAAEHRRRLERICFASRSRNETVLPPISNEIIAVAANYQYPRIILGQVETILRAVLAHFPDIVLSDLKSARRTANVVLPRQIAMFLIKECTNRTLPDIGRRIGGRDHTTVLYAVRKIAAEIKVNIDLAEKIEKIRTTIAETSA